MEHYTYYYALLLLFGVIAYMIVVDKNVADYIVLLWKILKLQVSRGVFFLKFYPKLRWDTFWLKQKSKKVLRKGNTSDE